MGLFELVGLIIVVTEVRNVAAKALKAAGVHLEPKLAVLKAALKAKAAAKEAQELAALKAKVAQLEAEAAAKVQAVL